MHSVAIGKAVSSLFILASILIVTTASGLLPDDFGEIEAQNIIRDRKERQSTMSPEEFEARMTAERDAKNESLKAQMDVPPLGFGHFDHPPSAAMRQLLEERDQQRREVESSPRPWLDLLNSSILAGVLLVIILLAHIWQQRREEERA